MSFNIEKIKGVSFLAFPEMQGLLISELKTRFSYEPNLSLDPSINFLNDAWYGDLLFLSNWTFTEYPYWARTVLLEPLLITFDSITDAAQALRSIQRSWAPYNFKSFRRSSLIQEKLPYVNLKNRNFPFEIPHSPIGLYTLLDEHTILASASTTSCLPAGTVVWNEDHVNPPSRAYLKVQEALVLAHHYFGVDLPYSGQKCFEAGACPGGWTWVLVGLGAEVFAVDRAPLASSLMENPLVKFMAHDAFTLKPEDIGKVDWVFSDVICYPERLLEWVKKWLSSGLTKNMICTIKMQGEINWETVKEFASIPNSRIVHLNYNKHELTFIHCEK